MEICNNCFQNEMHLKMRHYIEQSKIFKFGKNILVPLTQSFKSIVLFHLLESYISKNLQKSTIKIFFLLIDGE